MPRHPTRTSPWLAAASTLLFLGCAQGESAKTAAAPIQPEVQRLQQVEARQRAVQEEYRAMQIPALVQKLEADSARNVEPFNSVAYREVVARGAGVSRE